MIHATHFHFPSCQSRQSRVSPPSQPLTLLNTCDAAMYCSKAAAEKAAIDGKGQDFDTQQCLAMQDDVFSVGIRNKKASARCKDSTDQSNRVVHLETVKPNLIKTRRMSSPRLDPTSPQHSDPTNAMLNSEIRTQITNPKKRPKVSLAAKRLHSRLRA